MQKLTFATCVVDLQIKTAARLLLDMYEALDILCSIFIQTHVISCRLLERMAAGANAIVIPGAAI